MVNASHNKSVEIVSGAKEYYEHKEPFYGTVKKEEEIENPDLLM